MYDRAVVGVSALEPRAGELLEDARAGGDAPACLAYPAGHRLVIRTDSVQEMKRATSRRKSELGYMSPKQYRMSLGLIA